MGIFSGEGLKRKLVAWLNTIIGLLLSFPILPASLQGAVQGLSVAVAALGGVATTNAVVSGTVTKYWLLSLNSVIVFILGISHFVPALSSIYGYLASASLAISALAAGSTITGKAASAKGTKV